MYLVVCMSFLSGFADSDQKHPHPIRLRSGQHGPAASVQLGLAYLRHRSQVILTLEPANPRDGKDDVVFCSPATCVVVRDSVAISVRQADRPGQGGRHHQNQAAALQGDSSR